MKFCTCIFTVFLIFITCDTYADLLITPTRIVFEERDRTQEVVLVNTANEVRTYALSWSELKQIETMSYAKMNETELKDFASASDFIRFTPRRITLKPGENQRVKLMKRRNANSQDQDYRSHLKFTVIPNAVLQDNADDENTESSGTRMKLNLFLNYSIPIIVKNDNSRQSVSLENLVFFEKTESSNSPTLRFSMKKTTAGTTFGNITLFFKASGSDDFVTVGYTNNVSIFHESTTVRADVVWSEAVPVQPGTLKIVYKGKQENTDTIYDEALLTIL